MKRQAVILFLFALSRFAEAQHAWEAKTMYGFLIPHHEDMSQMMTHIQGVEIGRQWKIDSNGVLDRKQFHPYAGIGLTWFNLNKSINGNGFAINGFYDAGLRLGIKSSLRGRFSLGLGYLTKDFDVFNNPTNRAIGSHFNGFMQILTYLQRPVSRQWSFQFGIGMSHFSNGNWSMPNLGINLPCVMLGLKANDAGSAYLNPLKHFKVPKTIQYQFSARVGRRQIGIDDPRNIANYVLETEIIYPHNEFRQWRMGVVAFFDRTYVYTKFQPLPSNIRADQITELALQAGHEYRIGKLGFVTDIGFYLYRPSRVKRMYYEGVGLKLYVTPKLVLINRLKAHLSSADYFEWGLCYNFSTKKQVKPGFVNGWKWIFGGFR